MGHRNRNQNREHKARKDPKGLAQRTRIHNPPPLVDQIQILDQEIADAITDWEGEGGMKK